MTEAWHEHEWSPTDTACDDCGSHPAFICDECLEIVDSAWDFERYYEIERALSA